MDERPQKGRVPRPAKTERQRFFVANLRWAIERLGLTQRALAQGAGVREDWLRRASSQGVKWTKASGAEAVAKLAEFLGCETNTMWDQDGHAFRQAVTQKHLRGRDVVTEFETVYRHFESNPPPLLTTALEIVAYLRRSIDDPSAEPPSLQRLSECSGNGATQEVVPSSSTESAEPPSLGNDQTPAPIAADLNGEQSGVLASSVVPASPLAVGRSPNPNLVLIKWTGSKQRQAKQIVARFPRRIETYYEPFLGGGAVLFELLGSDTEVQRIEVSDICEPLIELWKVVRDDPQGLVERYAEDWRMLKRRGEAYFMHVRREFNVNRSPYDLFFLTRTCRAGHVRFNQKGEFNAKNHESNPGMSPKSVSALVDEWQRRLAGRNIAFLARDYQKITPKLSDLVYLDPPYKTGLGRYFHGPFDHARLFTWLREQPCDYLLSLNGFLGGEDRTLDVPEDLYDEHLLIESGECAIDRIARREPRQVSESLYVRRR